jgi:DNA-binding SARP family transcriptional activator
VTRAPGRVWRLPRAAAGLALVAVLLAGLPYTLIRMIGSPLPRHLPAWPQIQVFLTTPLSDEEIVKGLACVVWLLWAIFALSVIVEAAAAVRGQPAPRLPGIAPVQAFAAALIGATVLTAVPVPQASPQAAPLHAVLTTHVAATVPTWPEGLATAISADVAAAPATVAFNAGDSSHPSASEAATPHPRIHRVVDGDNLWDIAQRYLGNGEDWHEIFELNRGKPQPDGQALNDPDLIEPGWVLLLPSAAVSHSGPPADAAGQHSRGPAPVRTPATRPAAGRPSPSPRPPLPSASPAPSSAPAHRPSAHARPHPHPRRPAAVDLPSGALVGLSLAIAAGLAIGATRLHRRRRREPAPVPGTAPAEPALGPALRRIRHAHLTGLSQQASNADAEPEDTEPAAAARPPAADDGIPPRHEASTETVNVAVREGREIALDLACAPGIGFAGPGAPAAIRGIAVALLARRTQDQAEVILCGEDACRLLAFAAGEPALAEVPGLTALPEADDALTRLESEIIHRRRLLDAAEDDDLAAYRAANPDEHLPTILVIAPVHGPRTSRIAAVLTLGQRLGITGALPGPWPPGVTCEVAADGQVTTVSAVQLRDLEGSRMFQLTPSDAAEMLTTLATASGAAHPPDAGQPRLLPAPPESEPEPGDLAAHLSILGPFQLHGGGELIAKGLRRKAAELLAYLAVHRDGATSEAILEALWPDTPIERAAPILHAATANIRKILRDATGAPEAGFIVRVGEQLRIDPHLVDADLWRFQAELASAAHAPDDEARRASLHAAADLWRGDLADGIDAVWIEEFRETLRRDAVDTLARLAQLSEHEHPEQALAFLERAISIDRYQEPLYRRIMRIQADLGRPDAARRTYQLLESRLTELDVEPDETTAQLLHSRTTRRADVKSATPAGSADQ